MNGDIVPEPSFLDDTNAIVSRTMKTSRPFLAIAIVLAAAGLSGCGGYPMTVESRTVANTPQQPTYEQQMRIRKQFTRSREK